MADPKSIPTIVLNKVKWQEEMIANVHSEYQVHVEELLEQGFTLWKDALAENDVNELIHGPAVPGTVFGVNYNASSTSLPSTSTAAADPAPRQRVLRKRSSSQVWSGAKRTINGLVSKSGDSVTVCHGCSVCVSSLLISPLFRVLTPFLCSFAQVRAPLCIRSSGRYDYPLSPDLCQGMEHKLRSNGILNLVRACLCMLRIVLRNTICFVAPQGIY